MLDPIYLGTLRIRATNGRLSPGWYFGTCSHGTNMSWSLFSDSWSKTMCYIGALGGVFTLAAAVLAVICSFALVITAIMLVRDGTRMQALVKRQWRLSNAVMCFGMAAISYWAGCAHIYFVYQYGSVRLNASFFMFVIMCALDLILAAVYRRIVLETAAVGGAISAQINSDVGVVSAVPMQDMPQYTYNPSLQTKQYPQMQQHSAYASVPYAVPVAMQSGAHQPVMYGVPLMQPFMQPMTHAQQQQQQQYQPVAQRQQAQQTNFAPVVVHAAPTPYSHPPAFAPQQQAGYVQFHNQP
jgi:hypothetical protein